MLHSPIDVTDASFSVHHYENFLFKMPEKFLNVAKLLQFSVALFSNIYLVVVSNKLDWPESGQAADM